MYSLPGTIATAAAAFAATNLDALVLLIILFAGARAGGLRPSRVVLAQCLVFATLVGVSAAVATALAVVPLRWVGLLGFLPLLMGVRGLIAATRRDEQDPVVTDRLAVIVALTLSVCADNLSVYIVLFRVQTMLDSAISVGVFALLEALWCTAAYVIAAQKTVILLVRRTGVWLVPTLFLALGVAILIRTGLITAL
jgi:cadmium resistance protein CadD (predicted permease)